MDPLQQLELETAALGFFRTRYLTVAGLVILLWDHCLTFDRERRCIWPARGNIGKWGFLFCRYVVPPILLVEAYTNSGLSSTRFSTTVSTHLIQFIDENNQVCQFCKSWVVITCLSGVTLSAFSRALVLLRLWSLWNGLGIVIFAGSVVFVIAEVGSVVSMTLSIYESWTTYQFIPLFHVCGVTQKPEALKGVWGFTVFLELFMFIMVFVNALSRPRRAHTFLLGILYRDGVIFFLAISGTGLMTLPEKAFLTGEIVALGWLNLTVAINAPASEVFVGAYCIWALVTTIVSRMIINLQEAEKQYIDAVGFQGGLA